MGIPISGVFAPRLPGSKQPIPHLLPSDSQQRTDQRDAVTELPGSRHPGETSRTGAAQDPLQDCLSLVIGGVGDDHVPTAGLAGHLLEELIA